MSTLLHISDRHDCKWNVFDSNDVFVDDAMAIYNNTSFEIVVNGWISPNSLYILKGKNDCKNFVYFSSQTNSDESGKWSHTTKITKNGNEKKQPRTIVINITNQDFSTFFLKNGIAGLKCNKTKCGCDSELCHKERNKWKILIFEFNRKEKTFTLNLSEEFDYDNVYLFQMNFNSNFKSQLTLSFDVTESWEPIIIKETEKPKSIIIKVPSLCTKFLNDNSNLTDTYINGYNLKKAQNSFNIVEVKKFNDKLNLTFGSKFNYSKTYEFNCSEARHHFIIAFNFEIQKTVASASAPLGLGIGFALFVLVAIGAMIVVRRRKMRKNEHNSPLNYPFIDEPTGPEMVDLFNRKFPKSTVKDWDAITLGAELGGGQFGTVHRGFLHISDYQRYSP